MPRPRFTLRGMLVAVAVVGLLLGAAVEIRVSIRHRERALSYSLKAGLAAAEAATAEEHREALKHAVALWRILGPRGTAVAEPTRSAFDAEISRLDRAESMDRTARIKAGADLGEPGRSARTQLGIGYLFEEMELNSPSRSDDEDAASRLRQEQIWAERSRWWDDRARIHRRAEAHARKMRWKYERAAWYPWLAVPPDPPEPK